MQVPLSPAAREALFRLQAPNAVAREILVIPLDETCGRRAAEVAAEPWRNARFVPFTQKGEAWRAVLAERSPDLVMLIGRAGTELSQAIALGEICVERRIKIAGVLIRDGVLDISASLRGLRPWTQTLAVVADAEYLPGLLHALGA